MTPPDGFPLETLESASGVDVNSAVGHSALHGFPSAGTSRREPGVGYSVPCAPALRDAVLALAALRGAEPASLASAALLLAGEALPADPGTPEEGELAFLDLRLAPGLDDSTIRRALAFALALADPRAWRLTPAAELARLEAAVEKLDYRNKALTNALERVSFQPLDGKLTQVRDAAQLFGFVNEWCFDEDRVVRRFRELAPVYHPDTGMVGCRERMAQLIEARNILVHHVRTAYTSGEWAKRAPR